MKICSLKPTSTVYPLFITFLFLTFSISILLPERTWMLLYILMGRSDILICSFLLTRTIKYILTFLCIDMYIFSNDLLLLIKLAFLNRQIVVLDTFSRRDRTATKHMDVYDNLCVTIFPDKISRILSHVLSCFL